MSPVRILLTILLLTASPVLAGQDGAPEQAGPAPPAPATLPAAGRAPLAEFARNDRRCREISDGCVVCMVADQRLTCSLPGIACIRARPACRRLSPTP